MDIYDERFVASLFNRMSKTYGLTNYLSSFGFTERWRSQCIAEISWDKKYRTGYDLMSGMGETWNLISKKSNGQHKLFGVDLSREMNNQAQKITHDFANLNIEILQQNILENEIEDASADYIVSSFGLKTFSKPQLKKLAFEINRILKINGEFSLIEISKPKSIFLVIPYMFYLKFVIPLIGKLLMGNSVDYKMLGIYCENFQDCSQFKNNLEELGLKVQMKKYFFGCATGVVGVKE